MYFVSLKVKFLILNLFLDKLLADLNLVGKEAF